MQKNICAYQKKVVPLCPKMENTISLLIYFLKTNLLLLTNSFIMKKLFTILAAMLISMVGFAQTPVYELVPATGSNSAYASNCDITIAGITWNLAGNSTMQPWRIGGKSITDQDRALYSKTAMPFNISKIEVTHGAASSITVNSFKVIVSDAANGAGVEIPVTFQANATTTIELPAGADYTNKYFKFLYNVTNTTTSNRFVQFTGAKFYAAQAADEAKAPTINGDANFATSTTISMEAAEGAKIYYTLDGTDPTNASTEYTAPFELTETTTVKAIAYEGEKTSIVMSSTFTKATAVTCAEAAELAMKVASNNALTSTYYVIVAYVSEVEGGLSSGQQKFWVSDAKDGAKTFYSYFCNVPQALEVGMKIQMFGQLTKYNTTPQMKNGQVTILPEDAPAATVIVAENTTISEMGQNLVLSATVEEKALSIMLWPGVTKGFGTYSGEGEGDYYGTFGAASLSPVGDATYTDNGNGTFTFKATMTDGTAQYDITMNGLIPVKKTYTIAGSSDAAFGTAWDPTNAENDMFLVSGTIYGWEKYNVTLSAGKIEFKICEDHAWTTAYPASNYELTIPADGIYTIMIMFDADSKAIEAFAEKTGDAVVIPTVAMHGNFAGPSDWKDTENFTIAEDGLTATLVMTLAVRDNYEFGMRIGGAGDWTSNGVQFTRENASAEVVKGSGNLKLVADVAGEYTFTWTYATNTLAITFPAKEEPQPVATWDEIVFTEVAAAGTLDGAVFAAATNAAFTLTLVDGDGKLVVDANEATYGTAEENATYTHRLKVGGKTSAKRALTLNVPADGKLRVAARSSSSSDETRTLVIKQGDVELYNQVVKDADKVDGRYPYAYADVKKGTVTIELPINALNFYAFGFQAVAGPTVGFENIEAAEKAVKFIENGQIFILRDGAVFNLMGARVK